MPFFPTPSPRPYLAAADDAGARSAPWQGVLDDSALGKLHELDPSGKAGLVQRVVGTYTGSLERLLGQFGDARATGDLAAVRHVAHTLKSSSASVGALALSGLCADVERRLRDGEHEGLEPRVQALATEAARVLAALKPEAAK